MYKYILPKLASFLTIKYYYKSFTYLVLFCIYGLRSLDRLTSKAFAVVSSRNTTRKKCRMIWYGIVSNAGNSKVLIVIRHFKQFIKF